MEIIKKLIRFLRTLLVAFMFAVCIVMGVVPVKPKNKEESETEIRIEEKENVINYTT